MEKPKNKQTNKQNNLYITCCNIKTDIMHGTYHNNIK